MNSCKGKMAQVVISCKCHQDFPPVLMSTHEMDISSSFTQLGISELFNLSWKNHILSIATHLRNLASSLKPIAFSLLLSYWLYTNLRFLLLWSTAPMFGVVLPDLLYIFLTKSSPKSSIL